MAVFKLKGYNLDDTIAAVVTPWATAALGVIRISGRRALAVIAKLFKPAGKKDIRKVRSHTLHYGWIIEKTKGVRRKTKGEIIVDEVMVSVMKKPHSYTKEDVVEISVHGGVLVLDKILRLILKAGVRQAFAGEFTYRALIHGRINLIQAEAVRDIVEAKTDEALALAQRQLRGEFTSKIDALKQELKNLLCRIEAGVNFPEDEIEISAASLRKALNQAKDRIEQLLEASREAKLLKEGLKCAICGKTNSGKSTLFNCLLKEERVITSRSPGTTRDVIEEAINIRGMPLRIYDTAGLIEPRDLITRKALAKTREIFESSDLIIFLLDGSRPLDKDDFFLMEKIKSKTAIFVINKIDLKQKLREKDIAFSGAAKVRLSALKRQGIKDLEKAIFAVACRRSFAGENLIFLSHYQEEFLEQAGQSLSSAEQHLAAGQSIDFVNFLLKESIDSLGKLTGEVLSEEILENIFSQFCIGK